jgi:hypothetical protein
MMDCDSRIRVILKDKFSKVQGVDIKFCSSDEIYLKILYFRQFFVIEGA